MTVEGSFFNIELSNIWINFHRFKDLWLVLTRLTDQDHFWCMQLGIHFVVTSLTHHSNSQIEPLEMLDPSDPDQDRFWEMQLRISFVVTSLKRHSNSQTESLKLFDPADPDQDRWCYRLFSMTDSKRLTRSASSSDRSVATTRPRSWSSNPLWVTVKSIMVTLELTSGE